VLFTVERDAHAGSLAAWRLPTFPPDHAHSESQVRRVRLPGDEMQVASNEFASVR
jgi:hypothetical protein